ncbi:Nop52-domain-containing protein [Gautieria morchelliformis]|nr:Nop52-domain-containing protein [Gautieria morchelliformis]
MEFLPDAPPLGKYLASSDKKIRDKAFKQLSVFLSNHSQEPLPNSELTKLWKGLFYCYWMSDKPLVQQALSSELAELVLTISTTPASLSFLRAFWEATVREWNGIDRLRLDKYYMLIRKFTNAAFRLLIRVDWEANACADYNAILSTLGGPLCPEDTRVPSSLAYHLADIYLEELDKVSSLPSKEASAVPLCTMLSPFLNLAARTNSNVTYTRIQTSLFDPLISELSSASTSSTESPVDRSEPARKRSRLTDPPFRHLVHNSRGDDSQTAITPLELRSLIYQQIFEVASREETRDVNRKKLYAMWKDGMEEAGSLDMDAS